VGTGLNSIALKRNLSPVGGDLRTIRNRCYWALKCQQVSVFGNSCESNLKNVSPGFLVWKSVFRCRVDGRSLRRSDSCLLKGEFFWLRAGNPRNEPWRTSCSMGAWRRGMAWGPPGSGRSIGDAVPSGGEAVPGGRAGMAEGWSGGRQGCNNQCC